MKIYIEFWIDLFNFESYEINNILLEIYDESRNEIEIKYRSYFDSEKNQINDEMNRIKLNCYKVMQLAKENSFEVLFVKNLIQEIKFNEKKFLNIDELIKVGVTSGMSKNSIMETINSNNFVEIIKNNFENALFKKIYEAPHIRLNGYKIKKNISKSGLIKEITRIREETKKIETCIDGSCNIL
tara:strand:+ start:678 stop:1229 length:552 start_codon:yes stop_codon:yes gene_type:complete